MTNQVTAPPRSISDVEPLETEQLAQPPPSSTVGPSTGVDPSLQQASVPPLASDVPADQIKKPSEVSRDDPNINLVELAPRSSPTFKERVYGYARLIRGTVLGQSEVKEQGTQVLRGEQGIPLRQGSQSSK